MFEQVLVPLDGSTLAEHVLPHVIALAKCFGSHVTLLRVLERESIAEGRLSVDAVDWSLRKAEGEAYLDRLATRMRASKLEVSHRLLEGRAAEQILAFAQQQRTDLIVLSSHGRSGLSGWNVSSVVQKVIFRAAVSIMIVRAYEPVPAEWDELEYDSILVPLDLSQRAEYALPAALRLSRCYGGQLILTHVLRQPEMLRRRPLTAEERDLIDQITEMNRLEVARYLDDLRSSMSSQQANVETRLLQSNHTAEALHDLADSAQVDLILLTAHGHTGCPRWPYGSLSTNLIAYGTMPILIVQDIPPEELELSRAEVAAQERRGH